MARSGMTQLISLYRSEIQESGTAIFSDDRIQEILDQNSSYAVNDKLYPSPYHLNGSVVYYDYNSYHRWLEGTATSTNIIYNSNGTVVTNYTSDFVNGRFSFDADQKGTAYYSNFRYYDFYTAVAKGWQEKAGYYSNSFDFQVEGRSFKKSQVVKHCLDMAKIYAAKGNVVMHNIDRGDMG